MTGNAAELHAACNMRPRESHFLSHSEMLLSGGGSIRTPVTSATYKLFDKVDHLYGRSYWMSDCFHSLPFPVITITRLFAPTIVASSLLLLTPKSQPGQTVNHTSDPRFLLSNLARGDRVARSHVHARILGEKVARAEKSIHQIMSALQHSQQLTHHDQMGEMEVLGEGRKDVHSHRLSRHDRVILRRREMRDAKGVPEDHVRVVELALRIGCDPGWDALRWLARGLRDVAAGWVDLVVGVCKSSVTSPA